MLTSIVFTCVHRPLSMAAAGCDAVFKFTGGQGVKIGQEVLERWTNGI